MLATMLEKLYILFTSSAALLKLKHLNVLNYINPEETVQ